MDAMDMDIDMEVDVDLHAPEEEPVEPQLEDTPSPGEVVDAAPEQDPDSNTLQPSKIFVQGLDVLNQEEVKAFVAEHFPSGFSRIDWIDDSSANLLFPSEFTAQEALVALCSVEIGDVRQLPVKELLPAKPYTKRPEVRLQVRFTVASDKKIPGAAQRSRFYLLHPEHDPETRKRRYHDRDGEGSRRRRRRASDDQVEKFDVNLYDDDSTTLSRRSRDERPRRQRSGTPDYESDNRPRRSPDRGYNREKELFPDYAGGRNGSRRRSASPIRGRDVDQYVSDGSASRNREGARAIKERLGRTNRSKELFPSSSSTDNRLDDVAELSSKFTLPLTDGAGDPPPRSMKLEDRITAPRQGGRLADRISNPAEPAGFSIRGAARQHSAGDQGLAIKGTAKSAKELFPDKFGSSAGKELFADRLDGRSRRRQRAGDLFD